MPVSRSRRALGIAFLAIGASKLLSGCTTTEPPQVLTQPNTTISPSSSRPIVKEDVRRFVSEFLSRRVEGSGAEELLSSAGREAYAADSSDPSMHEELAGLLYDPSYLRFGILFVDGPLSQDPSEAYEVGIVLVLDHVTKKLRTGKRSS